MSKSFAAVLLTVVLISCSREKEKPRDKKLPASINAIIKENNCVCDSYIDLYNWRGQKIYLYSWYHPGCDGIPGYYDINGVQINMATGYTLDQFRVEGHVIDHVWSCSGQPGSN